MLMCGRLTLERDMLLGRKIERGKGGGEGQRGVGIVGGRTTLERDVWFGG
jgi:hypothetical protein